MEGWMAGGGWQGRKDGSIYASNLPTFLWETLPNPLANASILCRFYESKT